VLPSGTCLAPRAAAAVGALQAAGLGEVDAFRGAMAVLGGCSLASYLWFLLRMRRLATDADNAR
jgi:hypothetical protein